MAQAQKRNVTTGPPVNCSTCGGMGALPVQGQVVELQLSEKEAGILRALLGKMRRPESGSDSRWQQANAIWNALRDANVALDQYAYNNLITDRGEEVYGLRFRGGVHE